jgi:hypothetical protein
MADTIKAPNGGLHIVTVKGMFDQPAPSQLQPIHPGATEFLTFRLDSDDALLGDAVAKVLCMPATERTLFDFGRGYQFSQSTMKMTAVETSRSRQGPFLARVNHKRENMINVGGHHRSAREGRSVVSIVEPAWIQVVHGGNLVNELRVPKPMARLRRLPVRPVSHRERDRVLTSAGIDVVRLAGVVGTDSPPRGGAVIPPPNRS